MGWVLAHGGRITGDEMALIAGLVLPLLFVIALVLKPALRGTNAQQSARSEERGRS
jgi:hypothetical protein